MTEGEMVGWHHQLDGHVFGWTPGVGDGQGGLACCGSWGHKELDTTERLNGTELIAAAQKQKYRPMEQERKPGNKPTHRSHLIYNKRGKNTQWIIDSLFNK